MAEIIYSVFVSSTYEDLRVERAEVQKALLKLKCFPVGMELFPSTDDDTWDFIKRQIAASDYYLLVKLVAMARSMLRARVSPRRNMTTRKR